MNGVYYNMMQRCVCERFGRAHCKLHSAEMGRCGQKTSERAFLQEFLVLFLRDTTDRSRADFLRVIAYENLPAARDMKQRSAAFVLLQHACDHGRRKQTTATISFYESNECVSII